ncbi:5-oxoprolinase/urea amidolyase family protein [Nocardioides flavescens]|uniref:5-oxoprolinase/urea amidolyase family protein n=1 Tax=Nocardioides flavescens TaxID=2691959 RepID=A0A6L7F0Z1_9ACTN|nr:5-oxoprolinase/urea amidolyase family protein [Nocardioides flavescens]
MSVLHVHRAGPLTTVQDLGRVGWAHLGVPRAGALDGPAAALAQRLVGNPPDAALLEVTWGGLEVTSSHAVWVAVTGAPVPVEVDGRAVGHDRVVRLPAGGRLRLGTPERGVRSYVAVAGGIDVTPVLGSRSTDTLAWLGPPRVADGALLPVGLPTGPPAPVDVLRPPAPGPLRLHPGPRADRVEGDVLVRLAATSYVVGEASNRVGLRLDGDPLPLSVRDELPSEGAVLGAVQVPPDGRPVVFLADHPPTGGYPVVAVVDPGDLWCCAQLRPGEPVRFALTPGGGGRTPR